MSEKVYVANGEIYNVKMKFKGQGIECADLPDDWWEYRVWLIDTKTGEIIDEWDSIHETYNGIQRLSKEDATDALENILHDVNELGEYSKWFDVPEGG